MEVSINPDFVFTFLCATYRRVMGCNAKFGINRKKKNCFYRILSGLMAVIFFISTILYPAKSYAQIAIEPAFSLPAPGTMLGVSEGFHPAIVRGLTIHPENPLQFDFIIDTGDEHLQGSPLEAESQKLIKYFLASLTTPENELWVNLSPYEKDRIIPNGLGSTQMGRDMLACDYLLKQLTASLIYPEKDLGNKFWQQVREKVKKVYGTVDIPVDTFNKVWVVPDKAMVYEHGSSVFVVERHLKVMLEEDYVAMSNQKDIAAESRASARDQAIPTAVAMQQGNVVNGRDRSLQEKTDINALSSSVVRELIIPAIEKEVNEGKNFAPVRQIYNSMILATWYKKRLREGLLAQVYVDKNKTKGIDLEDKEIKQKIYAQYLEAFKRGVYNYVKEDLDQATGEAVAHKYFSGGLVAAPNVEIGNGPFENFSRHVQDRVLKSESGSNDVVVSSALVENIKRGIGNAVLAATIAVGGIATAADTNAQPITVTVSQKSLASMQRMRAWLDDTVYKDDLGKGMPRIFRLPTDPNAQMDLWESINNQGNDARAVIERVIINDGASTYDASVWQIVQAISGNTAAANRLTDIYSSGRFGRLDTIRAWDPKYFNYQGKTLSNKHQGLFFRIIAPRWEQKDPLTGASHFGGYPGPAFDRNKIVWADWQPITGENAWMILGNLQSAYVQSKGDKSKVRNSKEMQLAESIYDALDLLTSKVGAIYYAPNGTYGNAPQQQISTENNLSTYAALRMMYEITQDKKYLDKIKGIEGFFKNYAWDKTTGIFRQGGQYDGRFTPNPTFAVDVNTWGIAVLGPEKIDQWFGQGAAMKMWQETKKRAGYKQGGQLKGVGYTDGGDVISAEWTAGAIQATLMLADFYIGKNSAFVAEATADSVTMLEGIEEISAVYISNGTAFKGYKYANKRYFIPFGWWANPVENTASTAWPYLVLKGFDPFVLGGKSSWSFSPAHIKVIDKQRELDNLRAPLKVEPAVSAAQPVTVPNKAVLAEKLNPKLDKTVAGKDIWSQGRPGQYTSQQWEAKATWADFSPSLNLKAGEKLQITYSLSGADVFGVQLIAEGVSENDRGDMMVFSRVGGNNKTIEIAVPSGRKVWRIAFQHGKNAWGSLGGSINSTIIIHSIMIKSSSPLGELDNTDSNLASQNVGGIDFNPANLDLQIKRDGNGVPLPLFQQPFKKMNIEGFYPIIINIQPLTNLPLFLGLNKEETLKVVAK